MEVLDLFKLVQKHYGYKAQMRYINSEKKEVFFFLYDAFSVVCSVGDRYGMFGAGIQMADGQMLTQFLGKSCSLNSDPVSIKRSLQIIDDYCRMRLPDKYLEEYDKAYKYGSRGSLNV